MRRRREDGAAAVEFAIVAPLLFMLVFGIIQFGIFFAQDLAISNGARQGARAGAVPNTGECQDIWAEVEQGSSTIALDATGDVDILVRMATDVPGTDLCTNSLVKPCAGQPSGSTLVVETVTNARLMLPFVDRYDITLNREGSYRCEYA